jgi:hypothetical protein
VLKRPLWITQDVTDATQARHLELLEQELKKSKCSRLATHIMRLKVAWGQAYEAPDPKHQAA